MQALDQVQPTQPTSTDILTMALRDLGVSPSVDSFEARKRIQKLGYILQKVGVLPSYGYIWYLHGPYAPELTKDLYEIATQRDFFLTRNQDRTFVPEIQERLMRLRELLRPVMENTGLLEATASILFLGSNWRNVLSRLKPALPAAVIEEAERLVERLRRDSLIG